MYAIKIFQMSLTKKNSGKRKILPEKSAPKMHKKSATGSDQELSSMLLTSELVAGSEKNRKAISPASVIR